MKKYLGLNDDGQCFAAPRENEFLAYYERAWVKTLSKTYYESEQLDLGHKFRPRLVYWGFIINGEEHLLSKDFEQIAQIAVCMELIHKASLLLDDFIDKDTSRHGKPTFHTLHGVERTVIYSLNVLSQSLNILNKVFYEYTSSDVLMWKSMNVLTNTLQDMTLGVLKELDLSNNFAQEINNIKEIMNLETSSLITNSLLIGTYMSGTSDEMVLSCIKSIGDKFGFIFQALNDLEPFCSIHNDAHKGSLNTDFSRKRKNICVAILYQLLNPKERKHLENSTNRDADVLILNYFKKYSVYGIVMEEIDNAFISIKQYINDLTSSTHIPNRYWSTNFLNFISSVIAICKNRLL